MHCVGGRIQKNTVLRKCVRTKNAEQCTPLDDYLKWRTVYETPTSHISKNSAAVVLSSFRYSLPHKMQQNAFCTQLSDLSANLWLCFPFLADHKLTHSVTQQSRYMWLCEMIESNAGNRTQTHQRGESGEHVLTCVYEIFETFTIDRLSNAAERYVLAEWVRSTTSCFENHTAFIYLNSCRAFGKKSVVRIQFVWDFGFAPLYWVPLNQRHILAI